MPSSVARGTANSTGSAAGDRVDHARTAEGPSRWPGGTLRRCVAADYRCSGVPSAGRRKEPAVRCRPDGIAAAAPRRARARAVSTVNRRGRYGSPSPRLHPGGSRRPPVAARAGTDAARWGTPESPAQPAQRRLASGSGPAGGPGSQEHRKGARRVADVSARGAPHGPVPPAAVCVLALATGSLARKRQRCRPVGRPVAIPFIRFLR